MICGLIVKNLNPSQLIHSINKLDKDICWNVFTYDFTIPNEKITVPIYTIDKSLLVKDMLIAFDIESTRIFDRARAKKKVLYLEDVFWLKETGNYIETIMLLQKLNIYTRSKDHQNLLKRYCGLDSKVVENYNLKEIISEECSNS